jgi:hypothetical protein
VKAATVAAFTLGLCAVITPLARSAVPEAARVEIVELLRRVGASGCLFRRNGVDYGATRGEEHLHGKFDALVRRDGVVSAEDFIERAATRSSLSGLAYEVRCPDAPALPSRLWLLDQLAQMRRPGA